MAPGEGLLVDRELVQRWLPELAATSTYLVTLREDADPARTMRTLADEVSASLGEDTQVFHFARSIRGDVEALSGLAHVPLALAMVLAALVLVTLAHRIVVNDRRHRKDHAVLRAIGITRRQSLGATSAQATTIATVALVVGIPLGIVAAGFVWRRIATSVEVVPTLTLPGGATVAGCIAVLLAAAGVGALLGMRSTRVPSGAALRTE
jgi:predicted lysophospholipase L1 biosynthesis ABC-type transport system permease subunit